MELLWRPVVAPMKDWRDADVPRSFAEVAALFEESPGEAALEQVRESFELFWNIRECVLDPSPATRSRADDFLRRLLGILERAGASVPDPEFFRERGPRGAQGYGDIG